MPGMEIKNDLVLYYGNMAGYVESGSAIVDTMFKGDELSSFLQSKNLEPKWTDGVFDRLAAGIKLQSRSSGEIPRLKDCRIWQLKPEVSPLIKFIGMDELKRQGFDTPNPANYRCVYDGQVDTNNLDAIWDKFNTQHPPGYQGHSLSMSDVVELYDGTGSEFHYVDTYGFKAVCFAPTQEQTNEYSQTM